MKSRLVILTMLVFGMLLSTAGAGLAVSGLSGNASSSTAQYPSPTPTGTVNSQSTPNGGGVLGAQDTGSGQNVSPEDTGGGGTSPSGGGGTSPSNGTQPSRQVEAGAATQTGSSLPFTGFAAIPILFGGLVLLGGGLVLRSRAGHQS